LDDKIENARQIIRGFLRTSNLSDRMQLLYTVAVYEDEEKLPLWADEYELPEYIKSNVWNKLLLSRYITEKNIDRSTVQNRKILYDLIKNTVFYFTDSVPDDV